MQDLATAASRALSPSCETPESDLNKAQYLRAAEILLGCARTGEANDPETYIAGVIRILSQYPIDIVQQVVDPYTGLPGKCDWLPKHAEIKRACDAIHLPRKAREAYEERSRKQLEERARDEALLPRKQTYEEFKAEMAARGLAVDVTGKPHIDTAEAVKARLGITEEQWNALPNLPIDHTDYWAGVRHDFIK